jgi:hypothetical protein
MTCSSCSNCSTRAFALAASNCHTAKPLGWLPFTTLQDGLCTELAIVELFTRRVYLLAMTKYYASADFLQSPKTKIFRETILKLDEYRSHDWETNQPRF